METNKEQMRAEFEAWARKECGMTDETFKWARAIDMFEAWQAALAQRVVSEAVHFYRIKNALNEMWHETSAENIELIKSQPQTYHCEFRTLYTTPPAAPVALSDAHARVTAYLDRRAKATQRDSESIHAFDMGPDCGIELLVSDLRAILAAATQPTDAHKRDAERYRKARQGAYRLAISNPTPEEFDAAVDSVAIAAASAKEAK